MPEVELNKEENYQLIGFYHHAIVSQLYACGHIGIDGLMSAQLMADMGEISRWYFQLFYNIYGFLKGKMRKMLLFA